MPSFVGCLCDYFSLLCKALLSSSAIFCHCPRHELAFSRWVTNPLIFSLSVYVWHVFILFFCTCMKAVLQYIFVLQQCEKRKQVVLFIRINAMPWRKDISSDLREATVAAHQSGEDYKTVSKDYLTEKKIMLFTSGKYSRQETSILWRNKSKKNKSYF